MFCSVHVSDGFSKKVWIAGLVGGVSSIQFYLGFLELFYLCKALKQLGDLEVMSHDLTLHFHCQFYNKVMRNGRLRWFEHVQR